MPFLLMITPAWQCQPRCQIAAAALVLVGMAIDRYQFIVSGQVVPMFKGAWASGLAQYAPSLTEWMIGVLAFAIVFAFYGLGEKLLDLAADPRHGVRERSELKAA